MEQVLSVEEKVRRYDEALKRAKECHIDVLSLHQPVKDVLEHIFPVLKESEDEATWLKKYLEEEISCLSIDIRDDDDRIKLKNLKRSLAWLEKQGEQKSLDDVSKEITKNKETAMSFLKSCGIMNANGELADEYKIERGEQKLGHEEEYLAKFKVGDWVVQENIGTYKIVEVCGSWYEVIDNQNNHYSIGFDQEYMCHLWTIDDAKDGDILAIEPIDGYQFPFIAIYKNRGLDSFGLDSFNSYCFIGFDGRFYEGEAGHALDDIHPATKEQRELLFSKMREAGYEWDAKKFKVGDWITNGKLLVGQVTSFDGEYYRYMCDGLEQPLHVSNAHNWHLWALSDAKKGDVLATNDLVFIFKELNTDGKPVCYCHYGLGFKIDVSSYILTVSRVRIRPATKGQRNLLFSKIHEAGYEWDAEKKELKNIKQELSMEGTFVNVDEVREDFIQEVYRVLDADPTNDRANQIIDAFDNLPTVTIEKQGEQQPAWSEEDERTYKSVLYAFKHNFPLYTDQQEFIKSLKDKVQPQQKWSDEAMKYLEENHSPSEVSDFQAAMNMAVAKAYDKGKADAIAKTQKEWDEEDERILNDTFNILRDYYSSTNRSPVLCDIINKILNWLRSIKDRLQLRLKQEWNKEDSPYYDDICEILINLLYGKTVDINKDAIQKDLDWFNSLEYRIQHLPKQGWSEEDEEMYNKTINYIKQSYYSEKNVIDWFKSIKDRVKPQSIAYYNPYKEVVESIVEMCKHYDRLDVGSLQDFYDNVKVKCKDAKEYESLFPQNTWKPSEEIMKGLNEIINKLAISPVIHEHGYLYDLMVNLRKKLKGE